MSFFQGIFCEEEKIAEARYWVVSKVFRVSHMIVAMKTVALRTLKRLRQRVRMMALRTSVRPRR